MHTRAISILISSMLGVNMSMEILFAISIMCVMIEWVWVLCNMARELKGTRLVKNTELIKYSDKQDGFLSATILCGPGTNKKYRYIDTNSIIGEID